MAQRLATHNRMELAGWVVFITIASLSAWLLTTRRMRAEVLAAEMTEALKESEERYRMLFSANKAVEMLVDPSDGRIVEVNEAAERFYGWPADVLTTMHINDINTLSDQEVAEQLRRAETEERSDFIFCHRTASGALRDVEVCSGPITVNGRRLLYSIVHDITQRARGRTGVTGLRNSLSLTVRAESLGDPGAPTGWRGSPRERRVAGIAWRGGWDIQFVG